MLGKHREAFKQCVRQILETSFRLSQNITGRLLFANFSFVFLHKFNQILFNFAVIQWTRGIVHIQWTVCLGGKTFSGSYRRIWKAVFLWKWNNAASNFDWALSFKKQIFLFWLMQVDSFISVQQTVSLHFPFFLHWYPTVVYNFFECISYEEKETLACIKWFPVRDVRCAVFTAVTAVHRGAVRWR